MFVCSCRAVTDRTVHAAIASGATCIEEIAERCGAGSRCGGCWPELERLLHEQATRSSHTRVAVA
ncbi:MAG: (2Fe-2S)-binding protein [Acidimicrobiales bacterium]